ncbi:CLUMA_CG009289, isoform A [Clunio marinus]|uniref:CLUMA_CG009289, isoform A n=1 Tax=Clunio marinus TaxID=568069 RepID=A0A1J1I6E9_9DIPT|nr:CLUMA_CG009289, isoform A [Clunio marinus]
MGFDIWQVMKNLFLKLLKENFPRKLFKAFNVDLSCCLVRMLLLSLFVVVLFLDEREVVVGKDQILPVMVLHLTCSPCKKKKSKCCRIK